MWVGGCLVQETKARTCGASLSFVYSDFFFLTWISHCGLEEARHSLCGLVHFWSLNQGTSSISTLTLLGYFSKVQVHPWSMIWAVIAQLSEVVEEEESEAEPVILLFASPQSDTLPHSASLWLTTPRLPDRLPPPPNVLPCHHPPPPIGLKSKRLNQLRYQHVKMPCCHNFQLSFWAQYSGRVFEGFWRS